MVNWELGVAEAIKNFHERKRVYPAEFSLTLIDYLVEHEVTKFDELHKFLTTDFIMTTLGHVTTPVHGPGSVPKVGGWYSRDEAAQTYRINPAFMEAWKAGRRLNAER
jgi:hypothetical protein